MKTDNLTELIQLLTEIEGSEPGPSLENGQVYASDGTIVAL